MNEDRMFRNDRNSHWPIFDMATIEMIKIVSEKVREATVDTVESKDGMVAYFLAKVGGNGSTKIKEKS